MKRIITLLFAALLFGGLSLQAAPVSKSRALDIAKKIFASQTATKAVGDVKFVWDGEDIATKSTLAPAFYVFTRDNGGFVIIAGDDNVTPVLAISDHNEFRVEGMPDNVKWWMDRMKAYVRSTKTQAPSVRDQWANLVATKSGPIPDADVTSKMEDHLTPEWDQGNNDETIYPGYINKHIYNYFCPDDAQNASYKTVTGCVATALGEVLTTLSGIYGVDGVDVGGKLPQSPLVASVEPYTASDPDFASIAPTDPYIFTTTYKWANLRNLTNRTAIQAAIDANNTDLLFNLGHLLADLGAMMHAEYSFLAGGTSAVTNWAVDTLAKYMGMNKRAHFEYAENYSQEQWRLMLKNELSKHPIIYNGRTKPEAYPYERGRYGHAYVMDGYGKYGGKDVFHMNFGWSGSCNGYYVETNLDTDGSWQHDYSYFCGAIFDFYPEQTSTYEPELSLVAGGTYPGMYVAAPIVKNEAFTLNYGVLKNTGNVAFVGKIKAYLLHTDNTKTYIADVFNINEPFLPGEYYPGSLNRTLQISDWTFGDRIVFEYTTDEINYKRLGTPLNAYFATMITDLPLDPVPFIDTKDSYNQNDFFEFRLKNHGCNFADTQWTITDPDGTPVTKPQSDGMFQLTKAGAYKIEAAITPAGGAIVETVVTYINVVAAP